MRLVFNLDLEFCWLVACDFASFGGFVGLFVCLCLGSWLVVFCLFGISDCLMF